MNGISKLNRYGLATLLFLILLVMLRSESITEEEIIASVVIGVIAVLAIVID